MVASLFSYICQQCRLGTYNKCHSNRGDTRLLFLYILFTGAACVVFLSHASYIAAVSARFMQLNYGSLDKKVLSKQHRTHYA